MPVSKQLPYRHWKSTILTMVDKYSGNIGVRNVHGKVNVYLARDVWFIKRKRNGRCTIQIHDIVKTTRQLQDQRERCCSMQVGKKFYQDSECVFICAVCGRFLARRPKPIFTFGSVWSGSINNTAFTRICVSYCN